MNTTEYTKLRHSLEDRFEEAREAYRLDRDALDRVWGLANPGVEPPPIKEDLFGDLFDDDKQPPKTEDLDEQKDAEEPDQDGTGEKVGRLVDEATATMGDDFNWKTVSNAITLAHPGTTIKQTSIAQVLRKKCDKGQIEIVEQGRGRRSTSYRNKAQDET